MNPLTEKHDPELERICRRFGLGEWIGSSGKLNGSYNVNVKIKTTEGRYVVRYLNDSCSEEHLNYLQSLLLHIQAEGIQVPVPLTDEEGNCFIREDGKKIQVTPFVKGGGFKCRLGQVSSCAGTLRRFHQALEHYKPGPQPAWSFCQNDDYFTAAYRRLKQMPDIPKLQLSEAKLLGDSILEQWDRAQADLPATVIHGDWHFWNQCYSGDEVSCVMDFDFVQAGPRLFDVAYSLWVIYLLLPHHAAEFDRCFLMGYGQLTPEEQAMLPVAVSRIGLFFLFHSAYSSHPGEKWKRQYERQVRLLYWMRSEGGQRLRQILREMDSGS
ncbi:phosphotransferase [Paenibacillus sp. TAB 01]|uniref:phosphotransferase n=1 Tax=Paenibacillus sp. TAB 01 TaxID=3368988 RepID=UPI003753B30D